MHATADTYFHFVMASEYAKTAQVYMKVDWETARCFVDMSMEHWRKVKWQQ